MCVVFTAAGFTALKRWRQPTNAGTDTQMRPTPRRDYHSGIRRNEVLTHATAWTTRDNTALAE